MVFSLGTERFEFRGAVLSYELLEKVWPMILAMSGRSVTSASFTFRCRIGLTEKLSCYFAYHSPDFLYRSTTIDFRNKRLPRLAPGRFYSTPGFGPDDAE